MKFPKVKCTVCEKEVAKNWLGRHMVTYHDYTYDPIAKDLGGSVEAVPITWNIYRYNLAAKHYYAMRKLWYEIVERKGNAGEILSKELQAATREYNIVKQVKEHNEEEE
jgi:hypothetical protein